MQVVEGGCFCGAVRYRSRGVPGNTMVCHCQTCRRVAGSPVVAWLTFARDQFAFTKGNPAEFASSEPVRRTFCKDCGTPLTYVHAGAATTIDITTCSLDNPEAFPPTHHSWLSHDVAWVRFGDGLPTFKEWRDDRS